jgi:hypothetical protein
MAIGRAVEDENARHEFLRMKRVAVVGGVQSWVFAIRVAIDARVVPKRMGEHWSPA